MEEVLNFDTYDVNTMDTYGLDSFTFDDSHSECLALPNNAALAQEEWIGQDAISPSQVFLIDFGTGPLDSLSWPNSSAAGSTLSVESQPASLPSNGTINASRLRDVHEDVLPENGALLRTVTMDPSVALVTNAQKPRRKRDNRGKVIPGNNDSGRRGKLKCARCRKSERKCHYDIPESICDFCKERKVEEECIKERGPITQKRLTPSRPLTVYDISIRQEEVHLLDSLYSDMSSSMCGRASFTPLGRIFARVYGPSLGHESGLRHAVLAIVTSSPFLRTNVSKHAALENLADALTTQRKRLDDPSRLDEGDLFAAYLLAMGSIGLFGDFETHANGVLSIMQYLSRMLEHKFFYSHLSPFWSLIRDDILWVADCFPEKSLVNRLTREFRACLGQKNIYQRQKYEYELTMIMNNNSFLETSVYPCSSAVAESLLVRLLRVIQRRQLDRDFEDNCYEESILVDCHSNTRLSDQTQLESCLEMNLRSGAETAESRILDYYSALISHHFIRLGIAVVEASTCNEGLCSTDGRAAANSLVTLFRRVHDYGLARVRTARGQFWYTDWYNSYNSKIQQFKVTLDAILRNSEADNDPAKILSDLKESLLGS